MRHTAWTQKSSVPSDWLPPSRPSSGQKKGGKAKQNEPPKSKEVQRLEKLADALRGSSFKEKDPKGGCFCQARMHSLSSYTPICTHCGLILCDVNLPHYACPHCQAALLAPLAKESLVKKIESQIDETLAKEDADRGRAVEEARAAAGAFPTLSATAPALDTLASHPTNQTHKILSVNSKTKKVTVSSYKSPAASRPVSRDRSADEREEVQKRVPPPSPEVEYAKAAPDPLRPWANLRGPSVTYVPPPIVHVESQAKGSSRRRKSKAKENQAQGHDQ